MKPRFSIVIPVFNRARSVCAAIDSICRQPHDDCEILVVDDGSTDGTSEIVRNRFGDAVRVMSQSNAGPGAARNRGVAEAAGDYVAFLDSDDLWFPWTLATYRFILSEEREPAVITSVPHLFWSESELPSQSQPGTTRFESFTDFFASSSSDRSFGSGLLLVKRSILLARGGFETSRMNGEDLDLALRLGDAPGFIEITSPRLVAWRQHHANLTRDVEQTALGLLRIIGNERSQVYPGGPLRQRERREIIARHARSAAIAAARSHPAEAWRIYRATLAWQLGLGRWKFCAGFPLAAIAPRRVRSDKQHLMTTAASI